jgi:hypothetical protein
MRDVASTHQRHSDGVAGTQRTNECIDLSFAAVAMVGKDRQHPALGCALFARERG